MFLFSVGDFTLASPGVGNLPQFLANSWSLQALAEARGCRSTAGRKGSTGAGTLAEQSPKVDQK